MNQRQAEGAAQLTMERTKPAWKNYDPGGWPLARAEPHRHARGLYRGTELSTSGAYTVRNVIQSW